MAMRYTINNGQTISDAMSWDYDGAQISVLFYDGGGLPATVTGVPAIYKSLYNTGDLWIQVQPFAHAEWRFNGPASRIRIDLTGVSGYSTYQVIIWRTDDPMTLIPDGAFTGLRALTTQPYTEANVKNGLQFNLRAAWPLGQVIPTTESRKIWFKTNAKPVIVKLRQFQYIAEEMRIELFVGPTGVSGGSDLSIHNYNGVNPIASTVQAKKNVTITNNGTPFDTTDPEYFFGGTNDPQRQNVDSIPLGRERILPANTEFAVVITNTGTGNARAQYFLDFYEGGTDLPLHA